MTQKEKSDAMQEILPGFGAKHPARVWADLLDMKPSLFLYYTLERGLTVEDLYSIRGFTYQPPKTRKPRESAAMLKTKERMKILLTLSGYGDNETLDSLEIKRVGNKGHHAVFCNGEQLGLYAYRTGRLRLNGGQGLPLWSLDYEDARIRQNAEGLWDPHPDTQALLVKKFTKDDEDIPQSEYREYTQRHAPEHAGRQTYDGFGKSCTVTTWARVLQVPVNTLSRHLKKGRTVEEFARERGVKP